MAYEAGRLGYALYRDAVIYRDAIPGSFLVRAMAVVGLPALGLLMGCVLVVSASRAKWAWSAVAASGLWLVFACVTTAYAEIHLPLHGESVWLLSTDAAMGTYALLLALAFLLRERSGAAVWAKINNLRQRSALLAQRWRSLPESQREDILNRAAVYMFCAFVVVGGLMMFLTMRFGQAVGVGVGLGVGMAVFGPAGFFVARRHGLSPWGWGLVCFLVPLLVLLVLAYTAPVAGVMAVFGVAGFFLARRHGRSPWRWGLFCFLVPLFGLLVLLAMPNGARRDLSAR